MTSILDGREPKKTTEHRRVDDTFVDGPGVHRPGIVFVISVALISAFTLWAVVAPNSLSSVMTGLTNWSTSAVGWSYLIVPLLCVGFLVYLACTRYGSIRLGKPEDRPDYSTWAWLAMILSAVMGIGLISYGVAEPVSHFMAPPHGLAEPGTMDAAVRAMQYSFFDWGLSAWGVFGVFGLAIAWSTHRKGRSGLISAMLRPVLGKLVDGWFGKAVDIAAITATLFGTTTSLGLGSSQIDEGMNRVFGTGSGTGTQVVIIVVVTILFTLSALSGVHRGVKYISQVTTVLGIGLAVYVLFFGPTNFISNLFVRSLGQYVSEFVGTSLTTPLDSADTQWMQWWTYFVMAWWISWGAFVGVFLAKISKGRTIRQFVAGVLVVPSLVFFGWFAIFGGTAIKIDMDTNGAISTATNENINNAFFAMLDGLPLVQITSIVTILLVALFFISGADANTYVLSMLSCKGTFFPRRSILLVWGALTGLCAIVLLFAGGLQALQQASLLSALPFTVIIALLGAALLKELRSDPQYQAMHPRIVEKAAVPGRIRSPRNTDRPVGEDSEHLAQTGSSRPGSD